MPDQENLNTFLIQTGLYMSWVFRSPTNGLCSVLTRPISKVNKLFLDVCKGFANYCLFEKTLNALVKQSPALICCIC